MPTLAPAPVPDAEVHQLPVRPTSCVVLTSAGQFHCPHLDGDGFMEEVAERLESHGHAARIEIPTGGEQNPDDKVDVFCRHVVGWRPVGV